MLIVIPYVKVACFVYPTKEVLWYYNVTRAIVFERRDLLVKQLKEDTFQENI